MQVKSLKWRCGVALVLVGLMGLGCDKKASRQAEPPMESDVIASVDGEVLTRAEVDQMVDLQMKTLEGRVPPEQLEQSRDRMAFTLADQFVVKVLLTKEADRKGIDATQEEIDETIERIKGNLPEGQTLEDLVARNVRGEAGLIEDVTDGIRINKLLKQEVQDHIEVTDEDVATFMAENKDNLQRPERVHARHILIKTEPGEDEASKAAKKAKLEAIRQQIVDGADFGEIAKQQSDCPSSQRGGDLGFFARGRMAAPFEDAAFSQALNVVGPVIETQFGYHIIEVTEREEAGQATPEEVRDMLKRRKQEMAIRDYVQSLRKGADITVKGRPLSDEAGE